MIKISYSLNIIALIACIIATLKIFSTRSINENLRSEILKTQLSANDLKLAVEEAKKGQIDKLAREKRKNKELEDSDLTSKDEINDLTRKRDELKVSLDEKSKRRDEVMASIQNVKVSLAGIDKEIETLRNSVRSLSSGIPILQRAVSSLQTMIESEIGKKHELEQKISSYDEETDILKSHYELTLSSLQKDFYDRPWLERGERVSVTYSSVDLNSGLLMLPIGKNNGLEQEMRFSVRVKGRSVCQIRIKEVAYDHCIAMIVPLLGNPIQLIEENSLDLIHL